MKEIRKFAFGTIMILTVLSVSFIQFVLPQMEVPPLIIYPGLDRIATVTDYNVLITPSCIVEATVTYTDAVRLQAPEGYTDQIGIANLTLNPAQIYEFQIFVTYQQEKILLIHYRDGVIIQNTTFTLYSETEAIMGISIMSTVTQLGVIDPITYEITCRYGARDIAVISVATFKTEVYEGDIVDIAVVVRNKGTETETFTVTAYYGCNETRLGTIEEQNVTDLHPGEEVTLTFEWNTTGVRPYAHASYTIRAEASILPGETNIDDNIYIDGKMKVKLMGDVNNDGLVDVFDLVIIAGGAYGSTPEDPKWDARADLNGDNIIDVFDLVKVSLNYGRKAEIVEVIDYIVVKDGTTYHVVTESNATISDFAFSQPDNEISFNITSLCGTTGFCWVTLPYDLLGPIPYLVLIDGIDEAHSYMSIDISHVQVRFTCSFSTATRRVQIIG